MNTVTYKPAARLELPTKKGRPRTKYFPVVRFYSRTVSDEYWLNEPQDSRSKALTIARNYIKNLKN